MTRPSTSDRGSFRRNSRPTSPSTSSIVTVKPLDSSRSNSRAGMASSVASPIDFATRDASPSSATRSHASGLAQNPGSSSMDENYGHISKWSQSTTSSQATSEHTSPSSFSQRLPAPTGISAARATSPAKNHRPADINTGNLVPRPLNSTQSKSTPNQLSVAATHLAPKSAEAGLDGGPRTPLLYIGQISSSDDSRYSPLRAQLSATDRSPQDLTDLQHAQRWHNSVLKPLEVRPKLPAHTTESPYTSNEPSVTSSTKPKSRKDKDKKSMLARALQRANDAVQLDNAQSYRGAVQAYEEACEYLNLVMSKTSGEDDKQKLFTIRNTYQGRIKELQQLDSQGQSQQHLSSESPSRPSRSAETTSSNQNIEHDQIHPVGITKTVTGRTTPVPVEEDFASQLENSETSPRHLSLDNFEPGPTMSISELDTSTQQKSPAAHPTTLAPPSAADIPPPLSPRRPPPPVPPESSDSFTSSEPQNDHDHRRESNLMGSSSNVYATWLENQRDSRRLSQGSSNHSVSSANGLRRRHLRTHSSNTEAEFDAALDAAVEAAYDDGYEPYVAAHESYSRNYLARASMIEPPQQPDEYFAQRNSIIAAAKAHVAHRHSQAPHQMQPGAPNIAESVSGMDSDEEERFLEEVTQELASEDDITRSTDTKPNVPRQSDSSTSSNRTWGSSAASSLNTAGTSLSTVDEDVPQIAVNQKQLPAIPPPAPPPTGALPAPPVPDKPQPPTPIAINSLHQRDLPSLNVPQSPSVQDRRSSAGQRTKRLKIETTVGRQPEVRSFETALSIPKKPHPSPIPDTSSLGTPHGFSVSGSSPDEAGRSAGAGSTPGSYPLISAPYPTPFQCNFPEDVTSNMSTPALTSAISNDSSNFRASPQSASPINPFQARPIDHTLLKSHSSLSLRQKGLLTPGTEAYDTSPGTPRSFNFSNTQIPSQKGPLSTPGSSITPMTSTPAVEDVHLFANEIHSPQGPTNASTQVPYAPRPLEPCPESTMLRPFWLMRRIYQTIAHPRGGYLSLKIFIPREVWKVKNVKLKNVDDKIANCDLLTAALLRLGCVDTLDADAVLQEMQAFESILDQAQANLSKKLGHDVGVQTVSTLFKEAPATTSPTSSDTRLPTSGDTSSTGGTSQGPKTSSKNYLSWRKLRNKNSSANLAAMGQKAENASKDAQTFSSVPMAGSWQGTSSRTSKRDGSLGGGDVKTDGPNAMYMSSLARLCDAAQILDQIARQVEDPGLKHSSPTHVGLELSSRHAAEFFAFYVCRFVIQDITLLADKFIKRASEWVLS